MTYSIDSVFLAAADLDSACRPYEALGLRLSPERHGLRTLLVGGAGNLFAVHFVSETSPLLAEPRRRALDAGRVAFALGLAVPDLDAALGSLASRGVSSDRLDGETAWLSLHDQAGADLVLVRHARPAEERHAEAVAAGLLGHALPLRRLDHLAVVAPELDARTNFWREKLDAPLTGEVTAPAMVIRQLRMGDAVLELLGPNSPDSPIWKRAPGLVSVASWEVEDVEAAAAQAKEAGFTVTGPAAGVLPGTRIATVQGSQLAGMNAQLLQYV